MSKYIQFPDCELTRAIKRYMLNRPLSKQCNKEFVEANEARNISEVAIYMTGIFMARYNDKVTKKEKK